MTDRPTYLLVLRAEPGVDPILALRAVLKRLLRDHGLKCIGLQQAGQPATPCIPRDDLPPESPARPAVSLCCKGTDHAQ